MIVLSIIIVTKFLVLYHKINLFFLINVLFFIYIVFSNLLHYLILGYDSIYLIYSFYGFYFIYFFAVVIGYCMWILHQRTTYYYNEKILYKSLIFFKFIFFLSFIVALLQYISNNPLMFSDENWMYLTSERVRVRSSGLFYVHAQYAAFLTFTFSISIFTLLNSKKFKRTSITILLLSLIALYFTMARTYMLVSSLFLVNLFLYYLQRHFFIRIVFVFNLIMSLLILIFIFAQSEVLFTANDSMLIRIYYWNIILHEYFIESNIFNILFGHGISHTGENIYLIEKVGQIFLTENLLLSIYMLNGLFGVLFYILSQFILWNTFLKLFIRTHLPIFLFFVLYIPVWFYSGIFGRTIGYYVFFCLIPALFILAITKTTNGNYFERNHNST